MAQKIIFERLLMRETTPDLTRISKYISLILRHKPEVIGIQLDAHGWADVNALLAGISRTERVFVILFTRLSGSLCSKQFFLS